METYSRRRRASLAWGTSLVYTLAITLIGFFSTPLLIRWLGPTRLGAMRTLEQVLGYMLMLYAGLGPAFSVQILKAISLDDRARVRALVVASGRAQLRQSLFLLPVAVLVATTIVPLIIRGADIPKGELVASSLALMASSLLLLPFSVYRDLLECEQRSYWVHLALFTQSVVATGTALWLAKQNSRLPGQVAATVLGAILYYALLAVASRDVRLSPSNFEPFRQAQIRVGWTERWPLALSALGSRVNLMTDAITVSLLFGAASVTDFIITQRLVLTGIGLISSLSNVAWAPLGSLLQQGQTDRMRARMRDLVLLIVGASVLFGGVLTAYNRRFVDLWVGDARYGGDALSIATALQSIVFGFFLLFAWTLDTQGRARSRVWVSAFGSLLNLALSITLGLRLGPLGVCLATPIAYLATDAWFCPWLFARHFGLLASDVVRPLTRAFAYGCPWVAAAWAVAHRRRTTHDSWTLLALELACVGACTTLYFFVAVATIGLRNELTSAIRARLSPRTL